MDFYLYYFALIASLSQGQSGTKLKQLWNQSEAEIMCRHNGGLASYKYFYEQPEAFILESEDIKTLGLLNDETAWISGFADFSSFVSWYGCFRESEGVIMFSLKNDGNVLYECLKRCQNFRSRITTNSYIGLKSNKCYCLNQTDSLEMWPDQQCEHKELEVSSLTTKSDETKLYRSISVYQIFDASRLNWKDSHLVHQCVYGSFPNSVGYPQFGTASFFSSFKFICESAYHKLRGTCGILHRHSNSTQARVSCFANETSTWLESYNHCRNHLGKLFDIIAPEIWALTEPKTKYWTGIFRTFKAQDKFRFEKLTPISKSCLAVKRVGSKLLIDPDDCNRKKRFLCHDTVVDIMDGKSNDENIPVKLILIIVGILLIVAVAVVIIITYVVRRKRFVRKTKSRDNQNDTTDHAQRQEHNNIRSESTDTNTKEIIPFEDTEHYALVDTERSPRSCVSDTLPRVYVSEDFQRSGVSEEYDKVNLKTQKERKDHIDTDIINRNIYNHTAEEVDTYDELGGSKSIDIIRNRGIYNEMTM